MSTTKIPPLLFGNHLAQRETHFLRLGERFNRHVYAIESIQSHDFFHSSSQLEIDELLITSALHRHIYVARKNEHYALMLPLAGQITVNVEGRAQTFNANQIFVTPPAQHIVFNTSANDMTGGLHFNFDLARLNRTFTIMTGDEASSITDLDFHQLLTQYSSVDLRNLLVNLIKQIDLFGMNVELLKLNAFDDQVYRLLSMLLKPEHFFDTGLTSQDQACLKHNTLMKKFEDYIQQHIEEPISLSELQLVLGVSARGLQYACLKHYDCTPREFIRQKKLDYAYELLQKRDKDFTIADIAAQLGFSNQSRFTRYFYERFGVMPSAIG